MWILLPIKFRTTCPKREHSIQTGSQSIPYKHNMATRTFSWCSEFITQSAIFRQISFFRVWRLLIVWISELQKKVTASVWVLLSHFWTQSIQLEDSAAYYTLADQISSWPTVFGQLLAWGAVRIRHSIYVAPSSRPVPYSRHSPYSRHFVQHLVVLLQGFNDSL